MITTEKNRDKNRKRKPFYRSKYVIFFAFYLVIAEILIMSFLSYLPDLPIPFFAIVDSLILLILLSPAVYHLLHSQTLNNSNTRSRTNIDLQTLTESLEELVIERTNKLTTSEAEQRAILESSADSIIRIDTDGVIHSASHATNKLFSYKPTEIIGKDISLLLPEDTTAILSDGFLSSLDEWGTEDIKKSREAYAKKKNGDNFPVDLTISECILKSKAYYVINIRDISTRKRVEKALRVSEERYRSLAENSTVGIWQIAPEGQTVYCNPAMKQLMEIEDEKELENLTYNDFFTEENLLNFPKEIDEKVVNATINTEIIGKKGTRRNIKISAAPIKSEEGSIHSYIGTFTDITNLKEVEEDLRKAKNIAEEATKLKDKYVSLVTHNLNGPLATILGYIDLITGESNNNLTDSSKRHLKQINTTGENMRDLIREILNISRFKSGQITPEPTLIDARDTVSFALKDLKMLADKKGIQTSNDIEKGREIYADFRLFSEVLHNLISNSIKFCDEGDSISIFIPENESSTIAVKDSGIGIYPERLETIFKYEEHTTTTGTAGETGTGFGLPLSNDIMKAHNGSLGVESTHGEGSIFFARLPSAK